MIRYTVHSNAEGTFTGLCDDYPYLAAIEDSFPDALEIIQDQVEREMDRDLADDEPLWFD